MPLLNTLHIGVALLFWKIRLFWACLALNYAVFCLKPISLVDNPDIVATDIVCADWEFPFPHYHLSEWVDWPVAVSQQATL